MDHKEIEFSIVTPAYNEADKISSTIRKVVTFMRNFTDSFELIVSDDGSTDDTARIVKQSREDYPEVVLLKNPHKGKGAAVWSGFMKAQGKYIYLADADLSTPIDEIKKLLTWIQEHNYDVVIGSRQHKGAERIDEPWYRHFIGRAFNFWVQLFALPGIHDSQCGFKLFTRQAAKDVFSRLKIYGSEAEETEGAFFGAFDVEVLYLARKMGYRIKEVPVPWTFVKTSRLNFLRNSFRMALDVLKVRLNDIKGVYKPDLPKVQN
jgi:glycosyltransferase involved in cell wall biosynthesis